MKVIQTYAELGEDRVLRVQLPPDTPPGPVDVLVVFEAVAPPATPSLEERRAAAYAGFGALRKYNISIDDFLEERRQDEIRREKALGS